ncbi:MAG TPA: hypothetical protein VFD58_20240 [Blastocatellia bacterium]|nr:hypothetical protein [Blastocatellia bacterium]
MGKYIYREFYRNHLPHFHPPDATLFVTFRLDGSIPQSVVREYKAKKAWLDEEYQSLLKAAVRDDSPELMKHFEQLQEFRRHWFRRFEDILHEGQYGPLWLRDERVAKIIADSLHWRDGKAYRLEAYCIMSNHVHTVFTPLLSEKSLRVNQEAERLQYQSEDPPLDVILHSLKSYTAHQANLLLERQGAFWESESYDHVIRDSQEHERVVRYVLNNPVKAGLVKDWRDWKWNWWCKQQRTPDKLVACQTS